MMKHSLPTATLRACLNSICTAEALLHTKPYVYFSAVCRLFCLGKGSHVVGCWWNNDSARLDSLLHMPLLSACLGALDFDWMAIMSSAAAQSHGVGDVSQNQHARACCTLSHHCVGTNVPYGNRVVACSMLHAIPLEDAPPSLHS